MSLGKKTVQGVFWNYISFASGKLLTFVTTTILTWVLVPEQFGQVVIALLVIQYLEAIGDLGIAQALIYQRDNIERASSIAFLISIVMGIVLATTAALSAPLVGAFFSSPASVPLIQVLALTLLINSFGQTQMALLTKELKFRQKILPDLSRSLVKGFASIALALLGFGAWSLIWGQVLGSIAVTVVLWVVSSWRPRLIWDRLLASQMLSYGLQILWVELLAVVWATADYIIVGRLLGSTDLGLYQLAFRVTDLLIINVCFVAGRVLFPSYVKMNHSPEAIQRGFLTTMRYVALITLPLSVGVCAVAPLFVGVTFGSKWLAMIPALQLLALRAGISTISFNSGHILKAIGKPSIITKLMAVKLSVLVVVVLVTVQYGIVGVALGQVGVALFSVTLDCLTMRRVIHVSLGSIWQQIWPALLAATGMGLVVWLVVANTPPQWQLPGLVIATFAGIVSYGAILWLTNRELCLSGFQALRQMLRPKQSAVVKY